MARKWAQGQLIKPVTNSLQGPVTTYYLTPEELAYYRSLKRPIKERDIKTTAPRTLKQKRGSPNGY